MKSAVRTLAFALFLLPSIPVHAAEVDCLAGAMWGEARGEGEVGMLAVADVVLNRANDRDVCAIVTAPRQFQGYGRGRPPVEIRVLAERAIAGEGRGSTGGARYFVRTGTHRRWLARLRLLTCIGHHSFYGVRT